MRVIIAAALAAMAIPAAAADWVVVAKSTDGQTKFEADADSLKRSEDAVVVWTRINRKGGGYFISHNAINCLLETYREVRLLAYDARGDSTELTDARDTSWKSPVPDSMMAIAMHNICVASAPE